jgi:hypothetical protein
MKLKQYRGKGSRSQGFCLGMSDDVLSRRADLRAELRQGLLALCIRSGFMTMAEMLKEEIEAFCGGRYEHRPGRRAYRWGKTNGQVVLGGPKLGVVRPRLRDLAGQEVVLPTYRHFRDEDCLSERVMEQLLAGVSSRRYQASLETGDLALPAHPVNRSSVRRHFIARTGRVIKTIKQELMWVNEFRSMEEAWDKFNHWVTVDYNQLYVHSELGFQSPEEFEAQYNRESFRTAG